jgi:hypothetical protein
MQSLGASYAELSDEFGYQEQTLRVLRMNHKHEVAVLLADATAKLDHIPAALRSRGREPNTLSKSALGRSSMFRPHRETAFMSVATDHEPR